MQATNTNPVVSSISAVFDAAPVAQAVFDFDHGTQMMASARPVIVAAFTGSKECPMTFDAWEGRSKMVVSALVQSGKSANDDSASKMLRRVLDDAGLTKPKATSKEAERSNARRAEEKAKLAEAIKEPAEALLKRAQQGDKIAAKAIAAKADKAHVEKADACKEARKALVESVKAVPDTPDDVRLAQNLISARKELNQVICALRLLSGDDGKATFDGDHIDLLIAAIAKAAKAKAVADNIRKLMSKQIARK